MHVLDLDDEGFIVLTADGERTRIGHAADPYTAERVPADLFNDYLVLMGDWKESLAFGLDCRREAERTYDTSRGW